MDNIKEILAKNIAELRQAHGMTQLDLAEKLNYSDKAVSKWERADSLPDVIVLVRIAELFDVPLDYLIRAEHTKQETEELKKGTPRYRHSIITAVSIILVWFLALFAFVMISLVWKEASRLWLGFIYAIPVSAIVLLIFNSLWFNPKYNYFILSLLMWSALLSLHLTLMPLAGSVWKLYLLGIPGQLVIFLWSFMKKKPKN